MSESFPFDRQSSPYTFPLFSGASLSIRQLIPDPFAPSVCEEELPPQRISALPDCIAGGMPSDSPHPIPDRYFSQIRGEMPIPELPPIHIPENHIKNPEPICNPESGFEMHSCTDAPSSDDVPENYPEFFFLLTLHSLPSPVPPARVLRMYREYLRK